MKLNKQEKQELIKWIAALRSGKYKQTTQILQDQDGYCCLGVACKVLIPEHLLGLNYNSEFKTNFLSGSTPNDQVDAPSWLKQINDNFFSKTGIELFAINDRHGHSFDEIADLLEDVYIRKVLD